MSEVTRGSNTKKSAIGYASIGVMSFYYNYHSHLYSVRYFKLFIYLSNVWTKFTCDPYHLLCCMRYHGILPLLYRVDDVCASRLFKFCRNSILRFTIILFFFVNAYNSTTPLRVPRRPRRASAVNSARNTK